MQRRMKFPCVSKCATFMKSRVHYPRKYIASTWFSGFLRTWPPTAHDFVHANHLWWRWLSGCMEGRHSAHANMPGLPVRMPCHSTPLDQLGCCVIPHTRPVWMPCHSTPPDQLGCRVIPHHPTQPRQPHTPHITAMPQHLTGPPLAPCACT
eukprot:351698-Chlamydomonas_euryale.AAC.6